MRRRRLTGDSVAFWSSDTTPVVQVGGALEQPHWDQLLLAVVASHVCKGWQFDCKVHIVTMLK